MRKCLSLLLFSLLCWTARAQNLVVPDNIYFADMHLQVKEEARQDIQKIVDALTRHPGYFQKKVDLADAYFPYIERVFEQEGVPTDFKYLVLQESGLVSDAVSTSNAVGFWQFKEASATELGIKVNSNVDERKHIIESSRGAAKYLLRNNLYYKNWFNTMLSYYQGLTGTKALTKTSDIGQKKMTLDGKTNKYLLTFLAHKIAYENAVGKNPNPPLALVTYKAIPGQTLSEIALEAQADPAEVERYNKWLSASAIPSDKDYVVLIPVTGAQASQTIAAQQTGPVQKTVVTGKESKEELKTIARSRKAQFTTRNGIKAIIAQEGDTKDILALQADISTRRFLKYNDLRSFDPIVAGKAYYLKTKNSKSETDYHIARPGESMHDVAQEYGIRLSRLLSKNRMKKTEALVAGRVVWLRDTRPRKTPVEFKTVEVEFKEEKAAPAKENQIIAQTTTNSQESASKTSSPATEQAASSTASQPVAQTTPAAPAKPKEGAISVEVEDTSAKPYVPLAQREAAHDTTVIAATPAAIYPTKESTPQATSNATTQPKSPDEPLVAETKPVAPTKQKPATVEVASVHVVEKGETLYAISKMYDISMENLLAWNQLDVNAPLALGQEINLSSAAKAATGSTSVASTTTVPAKTAPVSATEHTVAAGETLYSISRKYSISLQDLQTWNNLGSSGAIAVGQKLAVTAPVQPAAETNSTVAAVSTAKSPAGTVTHKVAPGESMYQISRKYGVTIKEIMEWNSKADFNVSAGENLIIKPKL